MSGGETTRYELGRFASLVCFDGRWHVSSPSANVEAEVELPPLLADALLELAACAADARPRNAWLGELEARGIGAGQAAATVDAAIELGLLVVERRAEAWERLAERVGEVGEETCAYLSTTDTVVYLDYAQAGSREDDRHLMARYAAEAPPPSPLLRLSDAAPLRLPRAEPEEPATTALERLGRLLFWPFGRVRGIRLHGRFELMLKPVPSLGARHPFEAYVFVGEEAASLPRGVHHYRPDDHALERIAEHAGPGAGVRLAITMRPERCQWRYRYSLAYKDIFLDLGHVVEMLHVIEPLVGVRTTPVEEARMPGWDGVREACVATFLISGLLDGAG